MSIKHTKSTFPKAVFACGKELRFLQTCRMMGTVVCSSALLLIGCSKSAPETAARDLFAMDTYMTMRVTAPDAEKLLTEAAYRIGCLEEALSVTRPDSDVARINTAEGTPVTVCEDTAMILQKALEISDASGGALDITLYPVLRAWGFTTEETHVPDDKEIAALLRHVDCTQAELSGDTVRLPEGMQLDLGALAKGYTGDAVMQIFREGDADSAIISLGGNVQTLGSRPDGSPWQVGVTDPFSPSESMCILSVEDKAVITSGNYERYFTDENGNRWWHILDPADGYPADNGLVSVTVVGKEGLYCDALSTALFVEGTERAQAHWRQAQDFEMLLVTDDGRILLTEGLSGCFTNCSSYPVEVLTHE